MANLNIAIAIAGQNKASGPIDTVTTSLHRLEDAATMGGQKLGVMGVALGTAAGNLITGGIGLAANAIGGLIRQGGEGVDMARDLQAALDDTGSAAGLTAGEIGKLNDLTMALGVDPQLKVEATEAAAAIDSLIRGGVTLSDVLDGAARNTVLLSNATGGDFALSAQISSDVMKLWNIEARNMIGAVNGVTAVTIASKFEVADYALALSQAGGVAASVGVEFEDFNTSIAAISPLFASGSDAGTSFKTFLQRLVPGSDAAAAAMTKLGIITGTGANMFFTATGEMKSMADIVGILNRATKDLSEEQKNQAFSTIFGTDAMRAAFALAGMTEEEFRDLQATMGKTDAVQAAADRMDNLSGSLEILGGMWDTLKIKLADKFLPILKRGVDAAIVVFDRFAPRVEAAFDSVAEGADKVIDIFDLVGDAVGRLQEGKPIDSYIEAITRSVGELFGLKLTSTEFEQATETIERVIAGIQDMGEALTTIGDTYDTGGMGAVLDLAIGYAEEQLPTWKAKLGEWGNAAWGWVVDATKPARDKVSEMFNGMPQWVDEQMPTWKAKLSEWGGAAWGWVVDQTEPARTAVGNFLSNLPGVVADNLPTWIASFIDWETAGVEWLGNSVPNLIEEGGKWLAGLIGWVSDPANKDKAGSEFDKWGALAVLWIANAATEIGPHFKEYQVKLEEAMAKIREAMWNAAWDVGKAIIQSMINSLRDQSTQLGNAISKIIGEEVARGIAMALANLPGVTAPWENNAVVDDTNTNSGGSIPSGETPQGLMGAPTGSQAPAGRGPAGGGSGGVVIHQTNTLHIDKVDSKTDLAAMFEEFEQRIKRANQGLAYGY